MVGKRIMTCMKLTSIIPNSKTNQQWIKDLNIKLETIKFLEENMGGKLPVIGLGNIFFWICTKSTSNKNQWHHVKL